MDEHSKANPPKRGVHAQVFRFSSNRMHTVHGFERAHSSEIIKLPTVTIQKVGEVDKVLLRLEDGDGEHGVEDPSRKGTTGSISRVAI